MRVQLMLTCLCDALFGEVGIATVRLLEYAGCEVVFPERQTCCGQPPFNAGEWSAARPVAEHCRNVFGLKERHDPVVVPSASCAAMLRHGYGLLFGAQAENVFELSEFLLPRVDSWPPLKRRVAFHQACHGRQISLGRNQLDLLAKCPGLEVLLPAQAEQCCGFGGVFSVTHPKLSQGIGLEKLRNLMALGVEEVVSGDMGCLVHLQGLIDRHGFHLRTQHYAQLLAEALPGGSA